MPKKRVLIIAAGQWQLPVIKKARAMGLEIVATDRYPDAPGFPLADHREVVDIVDLDGTLEVARKYNVDAVLTEQTDISVPTAAYVAEKMDLIGIGYETALSVTNKWLMREKCRQAGIPMPLYRRARNMDEAKKAAGDIGYPVIIKPVDSQGSRGVKRIENVRQLEEFFPATIGHSREKTALVEEFMIGTESTVEGFVNKGNFYVLAISEKKHLPPPICVATSIVYPPNYTEEVVEQIKHLDVKVMKTLGIPMGITHAEYMVTGSGPRLIEIGARGGGSWISSHIVPSVSGVDVTEKLLLQVLSRDCEIGPRSWKAAIVEFFILRPGRIISINRLEEAAKITGVLEIKFDVGPGDTIGQIYDDRSRPALFIATAGTRAEVLEIARRVKETVSVEIESGIAS